MTPSLSPEAYTKLSAVLSAFEHQSAAVRFRARFRTALRRVCAFPESGQAIPEHRHPNLRQFIVEPYRFFYFIDENRKRILVLSLWHGAQRAEAPELPAEQR